MSGSESTNVSGGSGGVGGGGMQNQPTGASQPMMQNIPVGSGSDRNAGNGDGMGVGESTRKKRGRPRKYGPEISMPVPLSSVPLQPTPITCTTFAAPPPPQQHQQLSSVQQQQHPPIQQPQHQPPLQEQPPVQQQQQPPVQPPLQQQPPVQQQPPPLQEQPPVQQPPLQQQQQQPPVQQQQPPLPPQQDAGSQRRRRGRPPSGGRFVHFDQFGSPGFGLMPHVIIVNTGEDVSSKIMSFALNGPRNICVLSATGAISTATVRQKAASGGTTTYQGYYELLLLSGSFMVSDDGVLRSRSGGLSVALADPDGHVVGGGVIGLLVAATPVQVVMVSFMGNGPREPKLGNLTEPVFSPANPRAATGPAGPNSPPSRGTLSDSGGAGSPINQGAGTINSTPYIMSTPPF